MYDLRTLSQVSDGNYGFGPGIRAGDVVIPREYYPTMLAAYPKLIEQVDAWFKWHYNAKSVVVKNFRGE